MFKLQSLLLSVLFLATSGGAGSMAVPAQTPTIENITFPDDANIINVKAAPYHAKGDGVTDDSAAIQAAFNNTGLIYFPNGTYLVSSSFVPPTRPGKVPSRRIMQGQSEAGVVIKLQDNTPAFADKAAPLALFTISHKPEQAFRNSIRNMTFDLGKGNAGAIGMRFYASNQGGMHHVTIRSGDGSGHTGLDLDYSDGNGPLLINDIKVSGFDRGINAGGGHLCTLEHIEVENQNVVGLAAKNPSFIRDFKSTQKGSIPAVRTTGGALVTLVDANCAGSGEAAVQAGSAGMLIRNLQTTGYQNAIAAGKKVVAGPKVALWTAREAQNLFGAQTVAPLPVKDTPQVPWDDPKTWANVMDFAPKTKVVQGKNKRELFDVTEALQRAIDSGATTVYFPRRKVTKPDDAYHLLGTVFVRKNVRRIIGTESEIRESPGSVADNAGSEFDAQIGKDIASKIVIEDGAAPVVLIERFDSAYGQMVIENRSPRTLVLSSLTVVGAALLPRAGDLFIEDVSISYLDINGQNVWARQLNMERSYGPSETTPRPNTRNNGGKLWIHGLKTEQNRTKIITKNGATEVSAYILANRAANPLPMFENIDSQFSLSIVESVLRKAPFAVKVRETRGDQTRELTHEMAPKAGEGAMISLFVGDGRVK